MIAEVLVLFALPLLLAVAAGWDLASFTIPNFLSPGAGGLLRGLRAGRGPERCRPSAGICWPASRACSWASRFSRWAISAAATPSCSPRCCCGWGLRPAALYAAGQRVRRRPDAGPADRCANGRCRRSSRARPGSCACMMRSRAFPMAWRWRPAPLSCLPQHRNLPPGRRRLNESLTGSRKFSREFIRIRCESADRQDICAAPLSNF